MPAPKLETYILVNANLLKASILMKFDTPRVRQNDLGKR
jgi:hypothetical protein